jgi:hypothetical protein
VNVRQLGRIGAAFAATAATITVLAACGGSTTKAPVAAASSAGAGGQQSIQAYIACLNTNGVKISLPSGRPSFVRPSGGARPSRSPGAGFGGGGGGFGGGGFGGGGAGVFGSDPNSPPTGVSQPTWAAALTACKSLQPTFTRGGGTGAGAGNSTAYQAYRNCLTSHGVSASANPGSLSTTDPTVASAEKTCAPLLPTRNPSPSPTS